ncbi:MAG: conjugal transfer protein TraX [Lachnospiraceae bacterium]|nr:conjugal transfer protein TraX [Lachnospiraceae bacterium]
MPDRMGGLEFSKTGLFIMDNGYESAGYMEEKFTNDALNPDLSANKNQTRNTAEDAGPDTCLHGGLNRDVIKYIAMFTMFLNHIANIFMEPGTLLTEFLIDIGYFTAPVMCYFLVEGYYYTHSRLRYALRLALFALVSEIPFCLAFTENGTLSFVGMDMIFTLLLCFLIILTLDKVKNGFLKRVIAGALVVASFYSDWAIFAPVFTITFAGAYGNKKWEQRAFLAATILFGAVNGLINIGYVPLWMAVVYGLGTMIGPALAGFVIVKLYNGKRMERGRTFSQWFFYLFYPVHLLILGGIRVALFC